MIAKRFKIPIYFGTLIVVCADDLGGGAKSVGCDFDAHGYAAISCKRVQPNGTREYYIIIGPNANLGGIVHECCHTVNFVFKDVGVMLDVENDEPSCYLIQWVFDRAHGVFMDWQKQKQNS